MPENPLTKRARQELKTAGLTATLLREEYYADLFGNALVEFGIGNIILRFVRDRSYDMVLLASRLVPDRSFAFADIEVGMGWKSVDESLRTESASISYVLSEVAKHLEELDNAFLKGIEVFEKAARESVARLLPRSCGVH